jgi:hypothetical protein
MRLLETSRARTVHPKAVARAIAERLATKEAL